MELNWSVGIIIFYTVFIFSLILIVILSTRNNMELIEQEYYQKDIDYDNISRERKSRKSLSKGLDIGIKNNELIFSFPRKLEKIKGKIHLFRPSNNKLNVFIPIDLDENNNMIIDIDKFPKGLWQTKTEWEVNGLYFFTEKKVIFQWFN